MSRRAIAIIACAWGLSLVTAAVGSAWRARWTRAVRYLASLSWRSMDDGSRWPPLRS